MPGGYIGVPLETDPDKLATDAMQRLMSSIPGWVPREGHLEVWLIEVIARMVAEARDVASRVPKTIFRYFGENLVGLTPINAAAAQVSTTWTMADTRGYTIPAGTIAAFRTAGDVLVSFKTMTSVTVSPGQSATLAGSVLMQAVDTGTVPNGLTGSMELVDALAFVTTIATTNAASGGVDPESDDTYLNRLSQELELLTPRPILASDFAVLARRTAGVYRALAIDGYNPVNATSNNERMVAVAVVDKYGGIVAPAVKTAVDTQLQAQREVNFVVNVIDPTFTAIDVVTTFTKDVTYVTATLEAAVRDAITAYLSPANWGGGAENPPTWRATANKVRYLELATLINNVPGVDYVQSLTINTGTTDVTLAGVAPLPTVGAITATVV